MYRLKVKLRGFDIGTQLCERHDGSLSVETKEFSYMICGRGDVQTFIAHGLIEEGEEIQKPKWTDEDMTRFAEYCTPEYNGVDYNKELTDFKKEKEAINGL